MRSGIYTAYCSCVRAIVWANLIEKVGGEGCGCNQAQINLWVSGWCGVEMRVCLIFEGVGGLHKYAGVCIIMQKMCVLLNSVQL